MGATRRFNQIARVVGTLVIAGVVTTAGVIVYLWLADRRGPATGGLEVEPDPLDAGDPETTEEESAPGSGEVGTGTA